MCCDAVLMHGSGGVLLTRSYEGIIFWGDRNVLTTSSPKTQVWIQEEELELRMQRYGAGKKCREKSLGWSHNGTRLRKISPDLVQLHSCLLAWMANRVLPPSDLSISITSKKYKWCKKLIQCSHCTHKPSVFHLCNYYDDTIDVHCFC